MIPTLDQINQHVAFNQKKEAARQRRIALYNSVQCFSAGMLAGKVIKAVKRIKADSVVFITDDGYAKIVIDSISYDDEPPTLNTHGALTVEELHAIGLISDTDFKNLKAMEEEIHQIEAKVHARAALATLVAEVGKEEAITIVNELV